MAYDSGTHTQNQVVVYVSDKEKEEIRAEATSRGLSMSAYLLSIHKSIVSLDKVASKIKEMEDTKCETLKK